MGSPIRTSWCQCFLPARPRISQVSTSFIKTFTDAYRSEFGSAYPFHKRDLKPAQELAAALGPERVIELATWAWKRASSYLRGRSVTIHGMHAVLAEVQAAHKMDTGKRKAAPTAQVKPEDVAEGEEWKAKTF